ncbi:hypothetical protein CALCODRAFT_524429 [Calocera cornea HHB12733]|uniref:Outer spore wall protein RRT8 n=1 Tax=Calocera cornea HHB12733 TaxID=1353952 RepID=A0A165F1P5_9BASI|nr:hypothetical protein CALCODRAFT_524429 [Calocera cornea HHB12733]
MSQTSQTPGDADNVYARRRAAASNTANDALAKASSTASRKTEEAKQGFARMTQIAGEGVKSGAYWYPIKGIFYLLAHPSLLRPLIPTIALSVFVSLIITMSIFAALYLPTAGVLSIFNGPVGFVSAVTVLLSFSGTVVNALARSLWLQGALEGVFDQVLMEHDLDSLVSRGREIKKTSTGKRLGAALTRPLARFSPQAVIRYVLSIPLNLIPLVGTVFFILYNGVRGGPGWHDRYFQLKKFDKDQKAAFIHARRGAYSSFGATALALNMVPLASLFLTFTSEVGAALWACDEEKRGGLVGRMDEGAGAVHRSDK